MWGKVRGARREGGVGKEAKVEDGARIYDMRFTIDDLASQARH